MTILTRNSTQTNNFRIFALQIIIVMLFSGKNKKLPDVELVGLKFSNPVGVVETLDLSTKWHRRRCKAGFVTLTPPKDSVLEWIMNLQDYRKDTLLAVNINSDIVRCFSLVYDFADLIIIDPDTDNGISSPDISDTAELLDELVNLRMCYERYTPVFLRLSHADTPDEIPALISCARLAGLDGIVAPTPQKVRLTLEECEGRLPVIGVAQSPEEGMEELLAGASLIETSLHPLAIAKLLKLIEKQTTETI